MANRAAARSPLVGDRGPAKCPACAEYFEFRTDRNGRLVEQCGCGYRAYVERRSGTNPVPAVPPLEMQMTEIHCHTCGGFIADPTTVSYQLADGTVAMAPPHTGLCNCAPAIVYGPPAGYLSSPALPRAVVPASRT